MTAERRSTEPRTSQARPPLATPAAPASREVVITRTIEAPRELVYRAFTDPTVVATWWGPRAMTTPVCELDVRPGGAYRIVMRNADGTEYPMAGFYREVVEPERLVFTAELSGHPPEWHGLLRRLLGREDGEGDAVGELVMTITFTERAGRTDVAVRTVFESAEVRDAMLGMGMREGWGQSLDRLEELLGAASGREIVGTRVIDAPRALVFRMFTEREHVGRWWGPNGFTTTTYEMDVRPGGVWRFVMHGPDGTDYKNEIVYREVIEPERLVYDHVSGPLFRATVTFAEEGGRTRLTMRMVFESAALRDKVEGQFHAVEGLSQTLDHLVAQVATVQAARRNRSGA